MIAQLFATLPFENEWIYTGGKWYYLSDNGRMLASTTANIDGVQYTFNSSGAWVK